MFENDDLEAEMGDVEVVGDNQVEVDGDVRDAQFYIEDAERPCYFVVSSFIAALIRTQLTFYQVENVKYKLPLTTFTTTSTLFKMIFSLPPSGDAEGSSNMNALVLNGVTRYDFRHLVQFLLRKYVNVPT